MELIRTWNFIAYVAAQRGHTRIVDARLLFVIAALGCGPRVALCSRSGANLRTEYIEQKILCATLMRCEKGNPRPRMTPHLGCRYLLCPWPRMHVYKKSSMLDHLH